MNKQFKNMQKLAFGKILINESTRKMTKSAFTTQIKEMILNEMNEAKKKKDEKADVAPQEDVDINVDSETPPVEMPTDTMAPEVGNTADINPTVKSIQDSLQKAFAQAKELGDAKLTTQIGNTITMLVRDQVLGGGQQAVAEGMEEINDEIFKKISAAVSDEDYNRFIDAATAISEDLISKGFEAEDIYDYLNNITLNEA
jgi:hypothetical protein